MSLQSLSKVLSRDYRGPKAAFSEAHVLKALLVIGEEGSIGREKLARFLNVGPGEVRTLIRRLKESGLIRVEIGGCALTQSGTRQFQRLSTILPWRSSVNCGSLSLGRSCFAVLVRNRSSKVRKGIEQRDAAVRSGANGAFTVLFKKGRFRVPSSGFEDCEQGKPSEPWISIREGANPKNGDTMIVSGADDPLQAEYGALSAALSLV
jgi:predicted transcriptional regulator